MQNVMTMPSAARVNFQGLGKWLTQNTPCFVVKLFLVAILQFFRSIWWVMLDFIWIYGVKWVKRVEMLGNMGYQRGKGAVMV